MSNERSLERWAWLAGCALFSLLKVPVELNSRLADLRRRCFLSSPSHHSSVRLPLSALPQDITETTRGMAARCFAAPLFPKILCVLPAPLFPPYAIIVRAGRERRAEHFRAQRDRERWTWPQGEFKRGYLFFDGGKNGAALSCGRLKSARQKHRSHRRGKTFPRVATYF